MNSFEREKFKQFARTAADIGLSLLCACVFVFVLAISGALT